MNTYVNTDSINAVKNAAVSAPPVTVTGLSLLGVGLSDWVLIVTLFWLTLQIGWFVYSKLRKDPPQTKVTVVAKVEDVPQPPKA